MRVLILGSGGREHALAWKISQSPLVSTLVAAPGNPGMGELAVLEQVNPLNASQVVALALKHRIDLVVVGPEAPLLAGVSDGLRHAGVPVFGPSAAAAQIEGSKAFAKEVMAAAGVATARSEVFQHPEAAARRALDWGPVVVKADGLAGGKGVVVAESGEAAARACRALGASEAGSRLILEEVLVGPELSLIALCDGARFVLLPAAQDHKRLLDGDVGPNTGGMGAYAPALLLPPECSSTQHSGRPVQPEHVEGLSTPLEASGAGHQLLKTCTEELETVAHNTIGKTLRELERRGCAFRGALFAGLMLTPEGPKVLEFNARLGDPETQAIMMLLADDLVPHLMACAQGRLEPAALRALPGASVGVVLAAQGYPDAPKLGDVISGLNRPLGSSVEIFHAGTRLREDGSLVTSGGRVVTVCARAATVEAARTLVYEAIEGITFEGRQFRKDIGARAVGESKRAVGETKA